MSTIKITDRTLVQSSLSFKGKIEVCKLLDRLKLDVIELGLIENIKVDSLLVKSLVNASKESIIAVPVALGENGEKESAALKDAESYRLQVIAPVSSVRMEYVFHKKPAAIKELVEATVENCKKYTADVEFRADDATRSDMSFLVEVIKAAVAKGATTVTLCDDAGCMLPDEFGNFVKDVIEQAGLGEDVTLAVCCSNDIAMADACAVAAIKNGAKEVKTSAAGQNITDLASLVKVIAGKGDYFDATTRATSVNIKNAVGKIQDILVGKNNSSQIAVATVEKDEDILSVHDDKAAVVEAAKKLGYDLSDDDADSVYEAFKNISSKKETVSTRELESLVATVALQVPAKYKLVSYTVSSGSDVTSMVHVKLSAGEEIIEDIAIGDGPVGAAFAAIDKITGKKTELDGFNIRAITQGSGSTGEAVVKVLYAGKNYSGKGVSTDIVEAAVYAYVSAINKLVYEEDEA